jgi:hypothetical protein
MNRIVFDWVLRRAERLTNLLLNQRRFIVDEQQFGHESAPFRCTPVIQRADNHPLGPDRRARTGGLTAPKHIIGRLDNFPATFIRGVALFAAQTASSRSGTPLAYVLINNPSLTSPSGPGVRQMDEFWIEVVPLTSRGGRRSLRLTGRLTLGLDCFAGRPGGF